MGDGFTHLDDKGEARMVDVSAKAPTDRRAVAEATVVLNPATYKLLVEDALPKGHALNTARIAALQAAKRTFELIPLCHQIPLNLVDVRFETDESACSVRIEAEARAFAVTGVEMEALVAAQMAAACLYDMIKAVQKDAEITNVRVIFKSGGKSGTFQRK